MWHGRGAVWPVRTGSRLQAGSRLVLTLGLLALAACSADDTVPICESHIDGAEVVTADWLNGTLTRLSLSRLVDPACTAADAIVASIDLTSHPPGPLELEITPDGRRAVVATGPGFFEALTIVPDPIPPGGELLVVDLESGELEHALTLSAAPMGIAISPDGATAYVACFGSEASPGSTLGIVDLASGTLTAEIDVGMRPEQVALDAAGTLGIVNTDGEQAIRLFETADVAGTLGPTLMTGADPSDVVFIDGEATALVTNSMSFTYSLVDASDAASPAIIEESAVPGGILYGASLVPGTKRVLLPVFLARATMVMVDAGTRPSTVLGHYELPGGSFPLTAAVSRDGRHAFVAHAKDHVLSVVDLDSGEARGVSWLSRGGPTYAALRYPSEP